MKHSSILRLACAGAVLCASSIAEAGFTYISQERSLYAVASDALSPGDPPEGNNAVEDREAASGFGTFNGEVFAEYFDPPADLQTARGTQSSQLLSNGIFANGLLSATAGDERAIARTRVHVDFSVDDATDYLFEFGADYSELNRGATEQPGSLRLARLVNGAEGAVLADEVFSREDDIPLGDSSLDFSQSGTLDAGLYRLTFDLAAINEASGGREILDYSWSLRDAGDNGGPNPIPLPPAAWAGLVTMGCIGAGRLLRRVQHG